MPRFFRWPSTRADTFSQAGSLGGPVGMARSTDNGDNWERLTAAWTQGMASMRSGYSRGSLLPAVTVTVFRSTDNGDNWTRSTTHCDYLYPRLPNGSGDIFAELLRRRVFRSTDNGVTGKETWA